MRRDGRSKRCVGDWSWAASCLVAAAAPLACGTGSGASAPLAPPTDANASENAASQGGRPLGDAADTANAVDAADAAASEAAANNDAYAAANAVDAADAAASEAAANNDAYAAPDVAVTAADASDATQAPDASDGGGTLASADGQSPQVDASDGAPNEAGAAPGDVCTAADPGNSDPSHASSYVLGTTFSGCIRSGSDTDYITFTTPPNPAGGYVVASFTAPGLYQSAATIDSYLYLATNTMIAYSVFEMSAANPGASLTYWFAAAPSTAYVLRVVDLFGMTFLAPYTFKAAFTPVVDPTKPNSSEATATMITLGTPVQSYEFHGYTSFSNFSDVGWQSYYEVNLAAKPATVSITNVPAELIMDAYLYGNYSAGEASILGYGSGGTGGGSVVLTTNQPFNAGPHYVFVEAAFNPRAYGAGSTPASYVLHPYTLVVTQ